MDSAGLSPEVVSGRLYAGAGVGSLVGAAAAWDRVAAQWGSAVVSYRSVVAELTGGSWGGVAAESMAGAASEFVGWMQAVALGAEETAGRVRLAVAAFEEAFAAVVPPSVVAANRLELASLVAGNVFGQNSALIGVNQAEYGQMAAQDVAAMSAYAAASAAATVLPSFPPPPQTTKSAAARTQAAPAAAAPSNPLLDFLNSDPVQAFETFYSGTTGFFQSAGLSTLVPAGINLDAGMGIQAAIYGSQAFAGATGLQPAFSGIASSVYPFAVFPASATAQGVAGVGLSAVHEPAAGAGVSANLARAASVGRLSVPASWTTTSAGLRLAAVALAQGGLPGYDAVSTPEAPTLSGLPAGIPMAGAVNAPVNSRSGVGYKSEFTVIPRLAREATADQHRPAPGRADADAGCASAEQEGTELAELRRLVAELAERREAATQLIRNAMDA